MGGTSEETDSFQLTELEERVVIIPLLQVLSSRKVKKDVLIWSVGWFVYVKT